MEFSLQSPCVPVSVTGPECFNPCFNGILSSINRVKAVVDALVGFNPCFNGILSSIEIPERRQMELYKVSILVLMEFSLQCYTGDLKALALWFQSLF